MTNTENRKKLVEVKHLKQYFGSKKNVVKAMIFPLRFMKEKLSVSLENLVQENQQLDVPYFVYINQLKAKFSSKEKKSRI